MRVPSVLALVAVLIATDNAQAGPLFEHFKASLTKIVHPTLGPADESSVVGMMLLMNKNQATGLLNHYNLLHSSCNTSGQGTSPACDMIKRSNSLIQEAIQKIQTPTRQGANGVLQFQGEFPQSQADGQRLCALTPMCKQSGASAATGAASAGVASFGGSGANQPVAAGLPTPGANFASAGGANNGGASGGASNGGANNGASSNGGANNGASSNGGASGGS